MSDLWNRATHHPSGYRQAPPEEIVQCRGLRLIDVREPMEFNGDLGHIAGAELVPLSTVAQACSGWDPEALVVVVCRSGNRSGQAAGYLVARGFQRVINLEGGMSRWTALGLPVARGAGGQGGAP